MVFLTWGHRQHATGCLILGVNFGLRGHIGAEVSLLSVFSHHDFTLGHDGFGLKLRIILLFGDTRPFQLLRRAELLTILRNYGSFIVVFVVSVPILGGHKSELFVLNGVNLLEGLEPDLLLFLESEVLVVRLSTLAIVIGC